MQLQLSSLKDPLIVMVLAITLVYISLVVLKRLPPFKLFLMVLTVSLIWHWVLLYKAAWASKHSQMVKGQQIPPECRPEEMTWLQTVRSSVSGAFSSVDKCEEYHKVRQHAACLDRDNVYFCRQSSLTQYMKSIH